MIAVLKTDNGICIYIRAISINALIYAINLAAINSLKYFNEINATLFTSGVRWSCCTPLSVKPRQCGLTLFPFLKQLYLRENTEQK